MAHEQYGPPSPTGAALTAPQNPIRTAPAPQQQLSRWQNFRKKLDDDPNFRMALMTAGLNMLRTPQIGQTGFDTFAEGALSGINTLGQLRQRDKTNERLTVKADLAERRTVATESNAASTASNAAANVDRAKAQAAQFAESLKVSQAELAERTRHNKKLEASTVSGRSTGAERQISAVVEALVASPLHDYEDSEAGRHAALLFATDVAGTRGDAAAAARIILGRISDLDRMNTFLPDDQKLTPEEQREYALEEYQLVLDAVGTGDLTPTDNGDELVDPRVGQEVTDPRNPMSGVGKVVKMGEDLYLVQFAKGTTRTMSGVEIDQFIGGPNVVN